MIDGQMLHSLVQILLTLVAVKALLVGSRFRFDLWIRYGSRYLKFNNWNDRQFTIREREFVVNQIRRRIYKRNRKEV